MCQWRDIEEGQTGNIFRSFDGKVGHRKTSALPTGFGEIF